MMTPENMQCLAVLTAAASSTVGIVVTTNNPTKARQTLYRFRKELCDPTFDDLQLRVSPDDSEHQLWVLRKVEVNKPTVSFSDLLGAGA